MSGDLKRGQQDSEIILNRPEAQSALVDLIEAVWGGWTRPADDPGILLAIADWMDRLDVVADGILGRGGSDIRVDRTMQLDLRRIAATLADDLGAAWAEAKAALPEGWVLGLNWDEGKYHVLAEPPGLAQEIYIIADTPAVALRALAAKLRDKEGE